MFKEKSNNNSHNHPQLIGIDIGGTKIRVGLAYQPDQINSSYDLATPHDFEVAKSLIRDQIAKLIPGSKPTAIGMAAPGPVNRTTGLLGPCSNLVWPAVSAIDWLSKVYNCPTIIIHDGQAGGVCEARYGAGKSYRYIMYVTISTGIGSSLILDGNPLPGPHNPEAGHMLVEPAMHSLRAARFEAHASGRAIVHKYGKIAAQIKNRHDWNMIAHEIAFGLFNLIVATDPEIVILGGGVSVHFKKFIEPLMSHLNNLEPTYPLPPIVQAQFVEQAPLIGALAIANDQL